MRALTIYLVLLSLAGCGRRGEAEFRGKSLSEWVYQAHGKDPAARLLAYDGLGGFPQDKTAAATLEQVVGSDAAAAAERLAAAKNLYRVTKDAGRVVASAGTIIRREADTAAGFTATKEAEDLLFWLGSKGQPLAADLQYARPTIRGRDAASVARRQKIQQLIAGIPKE
jgi:hypothetical protein